MFVKYIGPAHTRTVPRAAVGAPEVEGEANLVWDALNGHTVEMSKEAFEQLMLATSRGEWQEVDEMPELPAITGDELRAVDDRTHFEDTDPEASEIDQE